MANQQNEEKSISTSLKELDADELEHIEKICKNVEENNAKETEEPPNKEIIQKRVNISFGDNALCPKGQRVKRKTKPLTEAQKQKNRENLKKAREAKQRRKQKVLKWQESKKPNEDIVSQKENEDIVSQKVNEDIVSQKVNEDIVSQKVNEKPPPKANNYLFEEWTNTRNKFFEDWATKAEQRIRENVLHEYKQSKRNKETEAINVLQSYGIF